MTAIATIGRQVMPGSGHAFTLLLLPCGRSSVTSESSERRCDEAYDAGGRRHAGAETHAAIARHDGHIFATLGR